MTGWLIAGGILLLLAGLLFTPAVLHLTLQDNAPPMIRLSFFGLSLYRSAKHKKKRTKKQTSSSKKKKQKQTDAESRSLSEWFDLLHDACSSICKGLRRLTKRIRFRHVSIYIGVGNWDAAECAAEYAKLNTALYPCLAVLGTVCSVAYDGIDVRCCFGQNRTRYYLSGTARLSLVSMEYAGTQTSPLGTVLSHFPHIPMPFAQPILIHAILHIGGFSHAGIQFQTI